MSFNVNDFYKQLTDKEMLLSFRGSVTSDVINQVLEDVEGKLAKANENGKIRKKLYNVMVESLQNLYHHVEDTHQNADGIEGRFAIVVIEKNEKGYKITTGNFVGSNRIKPLKDKIDKINSLTPDELKDMYKFILNHQKLSAKGGGGLGLVDMARKTGNKLDYDFLEYSPEFSFFNLEVKVN